ncbi:hypothetical protein [Lentzea tibetensis]|nr:hypothetical protein [Lentzea tibetensis]
MTTQCSSGGGPFTGDLVEIEDGTPTLDERSGLTRAERSTQAP